MGQTEYGSPGEWGRHGKTNKRNRLSHGAFHLSGDQICQPSHVAEANLLAFADLDKRHQSLEDAGNIIEHEDSSSISVHV